MHADDGRVHDRRQLLQVVDEHVEQQRAVVRAQLVQQHVPARAQHGHALCCPARAVCSETDAFVSSGYVDCIPAPHTSNSMRCTSCNNAVPET